MSQDRQTKVSLRVCVELVVTKSLVKVVAVDGNRMIHKIIVDEGAITEMVSVAVAVAAETDNEPIGHKVAAKC
jgi:hypothetical protein